MSRYDWSRLNHLQVGKYAEYLVKMEFVLFGFDVYTSEVDDRGIDFVLRKHPATYYDVQVKSVRGYNYVFFRKSAFDLRPNLLAALVIFVDGKPPELFLIRSEAWQSPDALLVYHDYKGLKSEPEFGINLSERNRELFGQYAFENVVVRL
jgi:hypothetical protein